MTEPILWYFADPMCSWCWGFSPVMEALRKEYRPRLKIALVLGGLRAGETTPMTAGAREEILHHWHQVRERTGQTFRFDNALPDGFVYDTEPACRAVVSIGGLAPERVFDLFKLIQQAFYLEGRNVAQPDVLVELAGQTGVARDSFREIFESDAAREKTLAHFRHARQAGVTGFPTLILQQGEALRPIARGCLPLQAIRSAIDAQLKD